jgi:hypothetical protein
LAAFFIRHPTTAFSARRRIDFAVRLRELLQAYVDQALPDQLRDAGYDVTDIGEGERILPTAIIERFCMRSDGALELLTPGSTPAVAQIVPHAGICQVRRYTSSMS